DGIRYRNVTGVQTCALPILKAEHDNQGEKKEKPKGFLDKITSPVSMISIIGVLLVFGFLFTATDFKTGASEGDEASQELEKKEKILESYRLYISGEEELKNRAFAKLDAIGYENLPQDDQSTLIDWYLEQNQYTKALTVNPQSDIKVANAILSKHADNPDAAKAELETISGSFPDHEVFKYELGRMEGNHQAIIENSHLATYNDERAKSTVRSYVLTNQVDELDNLIDKYKDKENSRESLQKQYDKYLDKYMEEKEANEALNDLQSKLEDK